jgi:hypothetical protein
MTKSGFVMHFCISFILNLVNCSLLLFLATSDYEGNIWLIALAELFWFVYLLWILWTERPKYPFLTSMIPASIFSYILVMIYKIPFWM